MSVKPELDWIAEARKHVGLREIKGIQHNKTIIKWLEDLKAWWRDDETAWCGVFTAHCLQSAGVKYPKHWYRALDYLNSGTRLTKPAYGCIAVKTRAGGGHVCFVVGRDKKTGKLVCLGGNQSDSVCYALYNESDFTFMWYGKTSKPADHRYDLPTITGVTATKVTEA
ncbi:TIGR02594 family protein [Acinetobacter sp. SAAs470]|nr:TIGR02594 family protein [Acinetobacter sp. SAAs470]WOE38209.1 TIGR02594 family protein [Acinetobacter sp. SAAs474]